MTKAEIVWNTETCMLPSSYLLAVQLLVLLLRRLLQLLHAKFTISFCGARFFEIQNKGTFSRNCEREKSPAEQLHFVNKLTQKLIHTLKLLHGYLFDDAEQCEYAILLCVIVCALSNENPV